ncbi:MAG: RNA polymerase sigma factor, RpoD/SigA family [Cyanobacteria bacterium RI_101]|nr:RNA polymerase sigma factor, RpoD/SigA family [Cyanobacteria bacterium RI_101]
MLYEETLQTSQPLQGDNPSSLLQELFPEGGETVKVDFSEDSAGADLAHQSKSLSEDTVGIFFKEMARYPLLSAEEEVELARQVQMLMQAEELRTQLTQDWEREPTSLEWAKALGFESEKQLESWLHRGRVAKGKMIRSNLRLVVSIAKRYLNRGVPFLDLIQEGAIGLNRASEKFDPNKGYKFSTYAYWWIRQAITRTIANDARTIRLPIHIVEKLNKLKKAQRQLKQELHRNPNEEELAKALEVTPPQLRHLLQLRRQSLSLNHRVGKGEDTELVDLLEDQDLQLPEECMSEAMLQQELFTVLSEVLTEREKDVICLRYGLASPQSYTLEEVGLMFDLSRERVRQIQSKAMRKLRRPQVACRLKGWLS